MLFLPLPTSQAVPVTSSRAHVVSAASRRHHRCLPAALRLAAHTIVSFLCLVALTALPAMVLLWSDLP